MWVGNNSQITSNFVGFFSGNVPRDVSTFNAINVCNKAVHVPCVLNYIETLLMSRPENKM